MSWVGKPRMTETIQTLTDYPSADRDGTAELVEILQLVAEVHYSLEPNADRHRRYGRCVTCHSWWPCSAFNSARYAATEWLVRASNVLMRRNGLIGPAIPVGNKPARPEMGMLECYDECKGDCKGVTAEKLQQLLAVHAALQGVKEEAWLVELNMNGYSTNGHQARIGD